MMNPYYLEEKVYKKVILPPCHLNVMFVAWSLRHVVDTFRYNILYHKNFVKKKLLLNVLFECLNTCHNHGFEPRRSKWNRGSTLVNINEIYV